MVEAYHANVICPNKQVDDATAAHGGHLLESETYVGGHVECLQTGIYRNDIKVRDGGERGERGEREGGGTSIYRKEKRRRRTSGT